MESTSSFTTATMSAVGSAVRTIRTHALTQITAYTARAQKAAVDPEASTEAAHRERVAYWACTAREAGATEQEIAAAENAAPRVNR
ncbi:hypothetical protein HQ325_02940 [Rhodococcus sp. BP-349]|uniref:hypothetical protein n=1 Tax=unclassified Rhodococcus (in: high G+C Gram-positive bacteria) TaxID=192944 RepID=UPI001C9A8921|nr:MULTISPECIES: hypothetical protein [unclassified Rhodococcus (in: high G+C Gram-positive bacteria)]MBY6537620.1 hypothetical protein [Rhodococcus sp. BP-363]MBY6541957.1 hypothetical protein [Rhodococcus sp. BP-369]MBY6561187.1 hypothetical protein [Rhodococcus sp. BP-370]MBY6575479.1 hypothetical protein [Rhodococcus sp. BP-364]MBY6584780.1 hypothetical protein [Rhodococcus sp. BP-358]